MTDNNPIPLIYVGILSAPEIKIRLDGIFTDDEKTSHSGEILIRNINGTAKLIEKGKETLFKESFRLLPTAPFSDSFTLFSVIIGLNFHWQQKENQVFRGAIKLLVHSSEITVINEINIEEYLISVISSEMSASASLSLLKAHAVISRSWLLAQIEKRKSLVKATSPYNSFVQTDEEITKWYDREDHDDFDVCADDHCQRYQGITRASTQTVVTAVKETFGEVLMYHNRLCDTRFSKCCGGFTELFENAWEPVNHPYLTLVYDKSENLKGKQPDLTREEEAVKWILSSPDAFCNTNDSRILAQVLNNYDQSTRNFYRWETTYSQNELSDIIQKKTGIDFGIITALVPIQRGVSGRIVRLRIVGTKRNLILGKELEIRKALSPTHLFSSAFVVEKRGIGENCIYTLKGAGWGHGVGLCQIGAAVMGAEGYSYIQILEHYFKGAELKKVYSGNEK